MFLLAAIFSAVVGVFIMAPALVEFRANFLNEKITAGHTAALATEEAANHIVSGALERELLASAGIQAVVVSQGGSRQMVLKSQLPMELIDRIDLRQEQGWQRYLALYKTFNRQGAGIIEVTNDSPSQRYASVTVLIWERLLYDALINYVLNSLWTISTFITALAVFLYFSLDWLVTRPLTKIRDSLVQFRDNPEMTLDYHASVQTPSNEIGEVQKELFRMQRDLQLAFKEKKNLASIGEAVAKINHDLRNLLATAQISSDTLQSVDDPVVKRLLPRLERSLDRAITICNNTLRFSKLETETANPETIELAMVLEDIIELESLSTFKNYTIKSDIPSDLVLWADLEHVIRIFSNLLKNASEAMPEGGTITLTVQNPDGANNFIDIILKDQGHGIPKAIQTTLFQPFIASDKKDGSGLGLAISKELVEANHGSIKVLETGPNGTSFLVQLPTKPDT